MKKSKFLKKSLAMLLALMLVVAMIPLSAAAAEAPSGVVRYITVNDATVDLQSSNPSIQVNDLNAPVRVKLAAGLTGYYQLQAIAAPSYSTTATTPITVTETSLPANQYVTVTGEKTATISLQLVDTKNTPATSDDTKYAPYVITLNQVDARTTTDLSEDVVLGRGVYSAEVDKVNKVINVVLARHTGTGWDATSDAKWDEDGAQADLDAEIKVTPLEGATVDNVGDPDINGAYTVKVDNNDTFTVTSESKGNHSTYKVVATYKDAINSFSVDGVDGVISDVDKNDVPDTITVTLPKDAINDQWGYPVTNPKFAVKYKVEGNLHCTMEIYETNNGTALDSNVSVNSSNAVDKREQPPRKDGCSLFHVNARLRQKKMERRLQEKQIPIELLSKQVVLKVKEAAQLSGRGIRHKIKELVSQASLVLKDVQVRKRDSRQFVRHSGTSPGCVGLQNLKIGHCVSFPSFRHWVGD